MNKHIILLVEDDELDVISIKRSLKKFGNDYELAVAYNGKEALEMLKGPGQIIKPDVILLDLNMPKMNGIEFLKALRTDNVLKDMKVFIMTTSNDHIDQTTTATLGISGYIIKPLNYGDNTKKSESMDAFMQFHLRKILAEKQV